MPVSSSFHPGPSAEKIIADEADRVFLSRPRLSATTSVPVDVDDDDDADFGAADAAASSAADVFVVLVSIKVVPVNDLLFSFFLDFEDDDCFGVEDTTAAPFSVWIVIVASSASFPLFRSWTKLRGSTVGIFFVSFPSVGI